MDQLQKQETPVKTVRRHARGDGPHPTDIHVGKRLRLRRTLLGLSQESLAESIGVTFQQLQKYERGANRISASRLWDVARELGVDVGFFFEELPDEERSGGWTIESSGVAPRRETLELVRAYYRIEDPVVRAEIFAMVKAVASGENVLEAAE